MLQIGIPSSSPRGTSRGHHSVYLLQESGGSMDQVDRHNILKLQPTHIHPRLRALKGDIMLVAGDTHRHWTTAPQTGMSLCPANER